jgi:transposase
MRRFVEEADRGQWTLLPECLDDFIDGSNPVRVIDVFVEALDLTEMSFEGAEPAATGRPSYHPSVLLKLYIYGYLNRVQSSRRLEREAGRNVEVMWLLGRLAPDHKTIADFRRIKELVENLPDLAELIEPLLIVRRALREQIVILHRRLLAIVRADEVCRRLMTTPGVGPVVALTYRAKVILDGDGLRLQQLAMGQQHPQLLTAQRLDMHRTVKSHPHHLRDAARIIAVRLVDLRL